MSNVLKAIDIKKVITVSFVGVVLGSILAFVNMSTLIGIIIVAIGTLMIISNGYSLYLDMSKNVKKSTYCCIANNI